MARKIKLIFFKMWLRDLKKYYKMQLTSIQDLTPQSIIFNEAKEYKVKNSKIKYSRIPIETVYPDGKKGSLVLKLHFFFFWSK